MALNRRGVALLIALVVVLVGGLLAATAAMLAAVDVRAGGVWSRRNEDQLAPSTAIAGAGPGAASLLDSLTTGSTGLVTTGVAVTRLSDSLALIQAEGTDTMWGDAEVLLAQVFPDTASGRVLRVPSRGRVRYYPVR